MTTSVKVNNVMGIIVLAERKDKLKELTVNRALAAVPFGARYRLIDFVLSNMVNAGIRNVGVFVQDKYRSLMDHLGIGKEWDLNRQRDGLFILPPEKYSEGSPPWLLEGDILLLRRHMDYLERSKQEYVILSTSSVISNMDLKELVRSHIMNNADITMMYQEIAKETVNGSFTLLTVSKDKEISSIKVEPLLCNKDEIQISLDIFVLKRELLMQLIDSAVALGGSDFVRDILVRKLGKLKIIGYKHEGYAEKVNSLESYFKTSMKLLEPTTYHELFYANGPIYTKIKNEPPTIYSDTSSVSNSLIANGCKIEGRVENSILFRGVKIGKNAYVKNSIVMQKTIIKEQTEIENVIIDKDCLVNDRKRLMGAETYPLVVGKATIL